MENKQNIKKSISLCKIDKYMGVFKFFGMGFILTVFLSLSIGWFSIPAGFFISLLFIFFEGESCYFTYQETTTTANVKIDIQTSMTSSTQKRLSYIVLKSVTWVENDDPWTPIQTDMEDRFVCKVSHIDGKYVENMELIIPESQVFKREKYFWKQTFKPINKDKL